MTLFDLNRLGESDNKRKELGTLHLETLSAGSSSTSTATDEEGEYKRDKAELADKTPTKLSKPLPAIRKSSRATRSRSIEPDEPLPRICKVVESNAAILRETRNGFELEEKPYLERVRTRSTLERIEEAEFEDDEYPTDFYTRHWIHRDQAEKMKFESHEDREMVFKPAIKGLVYETKLNNVEVEEEKITTENLSTDSFALPETVCTSRNSLGFNNYDVKHHETWSGDRRYESLETSIPSRKVSSNYKEWKSEDWKPSKVSGHQNKTTDKIADAVASNLDYLKSNVLDGNYSTRDLVLLWTALQQSVPNIRLDVSSEISSLRPMKQSDKIDNNDAPRGFSISSAGISGVVSKRAVHNSNAVDNITRNTQSLDLDSRNASVSFKKDPEELHRTASSLSMDFSYPVALSDSDKRLLYLLFKKLGGDFEGHRAEVGEEYFDTPRLLRHVRTGFSKYAQTSGTSSRLLNRVTSGLAKRLARNPNGQITFRQFCGIVENHRESLASKGNLTTAKTMPAHPRNFIGDEILSLAKQIDVQKKNDAKRIFSPVFSSSNRQSQKPNNRSFSTVGKYEAKALYALFLSLCTSSSQGEYIDRGRFSRQLQFVCGINKTDAESLLSMIDGMETIKSKLSAIDFIRCVDRYIQRIGFTIVISRILEAALRANIGSATNVALASDIADSTDPQKYPGLHHETHSSINYETRKSNGVSAFPLKSVPSFLFWPISSQKLYERICTGLPSERLRQERYPSFDSENELSKDSPEMVTLFPRVVFRTPKKVSKGKALSLAKRAHYSPFGASLRKVANEINRSIKQEQIR